MAQIRPDEVSSIIREQLSNYKSAAQLEEVGTVLQVGDGIARIYGLTKVKSGELIEFDKGLKGILLPTSDWLHPKELRWLLLPWLFPFDHCKW